MPMFIPSATSADSGAKVALFGGWTSSSRTWLARIFLLVVLAAVWGVALRGGFRFDDYPNIVQDPATAQAGAFLERLGWGLRPLLRATYFMDHAFWGMEARGFLFTNLLLHAGAVLAVFHLAARRLGNHAAALMAALVFGLQPANAEAVVYLSGRSVLLSTALLLGALLAHERAREETPLAGAWRWMSVFAFVLAALARETALVYPFLLLAWEASRPEGGKKGSALVPGFLAALLAALLFALPRYRDLAAYSTELRSPLSSLAMNLSGLPESLSLWFRPWALSLIHPAPDLNVMRVALGLGLVLFLVILGILSMRGRRHGSLATLAGLAALWILIALAPTHGFIARRDVITERQLYLAWVGPSLLAGGLWLALRRTSAARIVTFAGVAVLLGAGWASMRRAEVWNNELRLWCDTVLKAPGSALAWNNLGTARREAGDIPGAAEAFRRAIMLDPSAPKPRFNLLALEMISFHALGSPP